MTMHESWGQLFGPAQEVAGGTDWVVWLLILVVLVAGAGFVLWSRRRGPKPEAKPLPEEKGEVAEELLLVPEGKTLSEGLERTRKEGFVARLAGVFRKELDADLETKVEEVLLTSDIGVRTANQLMESMREALSRDQLKDQERVWAFLKEEIGELLTTPVQAPQAPAPGTPEVILVVGVNGVGKTTTIGKLGLRLGQGRKVRFVAGDTFRAAAVEQLKIWADRVGASFFSGDDGADPASVVFDGIKSGVEAGDELILVDTAGRLHTKVNLVEELKKIHRVAGKALDGAPHQTLLVLDATNGQNALQQADIFGREIGVSGIALTKLDGTAKGGVIIGICDTFEIPVTWVGVGEQVQDLRKFDPAEFTSLLFGDAPD
jgi:fused signal recognition particle receptor